MLGFAYDSPPSSHENATAFSWEACQPARYIRFTDFLTEWLKISELNRYNLLKDLPEVFLQITGILLPSPFAFFQGQRKRLPVNFIVFP